MSRINSNVSSLIAQRVLRKNFGPTSNAALGVALENASAAESAIRDPDFAEEAAKLTPWQILARAVATVPAPANASPQHALVAASDRTGTRVHMRLVRD